MGSAKSFTAHTGNWSFSSSKKSAVVIATVDDERCDDRGDTFEELKDKDVDDVGCELISSTTHGNHEFSDTNPLRDGYTNEISSLIVDYPRIKNLV